MQHYEIHDDHQHVHGPNCGHTPVDHGDHTDYLHDGHLHRMHDDHADECSVDVDVKNPDMCTEGHECLAHGGEHIHGDDCGHEAVPHGDHMDYLVGGHLHHPHGGHCDDNGRI